MTSLLYHISILLISLLFACRTLSYQDKITIDWIDKKKIEIDRDSSLQSLTQGYLAEGEQKKYDGFYLTKYSKNDSLRKVEWERKLSYGISQLNYYYWNNRLIYAYEIEKNYLILDSTFQYNYQNPVIVFEKEAYFKDGRFVTGRIFGKRKFLLSQNEHPDDLLGSGEFYLQKPWYRLNKK
ncbi:hypothetical protein K1X84_00545 [bacterium]|nr:hypothetical protein [bacterium]